MARADGQGPVARLQRRQFLTSMGGLAALPLVWSSPAGRVLRDLVDAGGEREVLEGYWESLPGRRTRCHVCPLDCLLEDGETCFCRTRTNFGGRLMAMAWENPCVLAVDPVEKVPLNHFTPGASTLALGTGGCNLRCLYCQNWEQSQKKPGELENHELPVERVADSLEGSRTRTIAFTYTEPIAFLEYLCEVAAHARSKKVRCVAATALFATPKAARHLGRHLDAACVAIKGFNQTFYDRVCGSQLAPVLEAAEVLAAEDVHLEITTLVVPGYNDDPQELEDLARWIEKHLGPDTPWHVARFVPKYRLSKVPRTTIESLEAIRERGRDAGLRYVYLSNVAPHEGNHTYCARCGAPAIERLGFKLLRNGLRPKGRCPECPRKIPGVWQ